jgi:uncharacterized protein YprB with RNaseH-like and TPR domain
MSIKTTPLKELWYSDALIEQLKTGKSNRQIARDLFGSDSYESRIRRFLEREDVRQHLCEKQPERAMVKNNSMFKTQAKVCFIDIETSFNIGLHFGNYNQNLGVDHKVRDSHLLSYACAWNDGEVFGEVLDADTIQKDVIRSIVEKDVFTDIDYDMVLKIWHILDNADCVVAQNGKAFDIKRINSYFLKYDLPLPSPYKVYDTLSVAKKMFNMSFKSLKFLAKYLGVTQKIDNSGVDLWKSCTLGWSQDDLDEMLQYNLGDVITLREVYYKLLKYDNDSVNMALYNDESDTLCPTCGSHNISPLGKQCATNKRKYEVYRCGDCQSLLRSNTQVGISNKFSKIV